MGSTHFDVVVGGGSVGGLSFAKEAASRGLTTLVLEEDESIGEPEKCDGLVSQRALDEYFGPSHHCVQSRVRSGTVYSPSGRTLSLDASRLDVVVIDRSVYEEQLADAAVAKGASVKTGVRVTGVSSEGPERVLVTASSPRSGSSHERYSCSHYVDATGPSGVMPRNRSGLIPAAKYEVEGDWFTDGEVEVHLDQRKYPGFFAWVIPRGDGLAKVGVAGVGINSFRTLDSFLEGRKVRIRTKVAAPIYVGGPVEEFVVGRTVYVGESAGQVKPTTAGGILWSIAAGTMAARSMAQSMAAKDRSLLHSYQKEWEGRFGKEARLMKRMRRIFRHLSNDDLDKIVTALSSPSVTAKLSSTDFDFHASAMLFALGARMTLHLAGVLASAEAKQALASLVE